MTLDVLRKRENLSVRSYNVCYYNSLTSLNDIIDFYLKWNTFQKLRNCGEKSNVELLTIAKKYILNPTLTDEDETSHEAIANDNTELPIILNSLSRIQRRIINNQLQVLFNSLSVRSRNSILGLLNEEVTVANIVNVMLLPLDFKVEAIRAIGEKSAQEVRRFLDEIKNLIHYLPTIQDQDQLLKEYYITTFKKNYSISPEHLENEIINYDFNNGIPIFLTAQYLLENYFENNKHKIIREGLKIYNNKGTKTLNKISEELGITRERVRQVRSNLLEEIVNLLEPIIALGPDNINTYSLNTNSTFISIQDELVQEISTTENTNFNKNFISLIYQKIFKHEFDFIGNERDVFTPKNITRRHKWKNIYLVKKSLSKSFDFIGLVNDIEVRLDDKNREDYTLHFTSYISNFLDNKDYSKIDQLSQICEMIIGYEHSMYVDLNDYILFETSTFKSISDYVHDILVEAKELMKIDDIFEIINSKFPGITKNRDALRGSIQQDERVIKFGRTSTYGLKVWEQERRGIKGGTIRNIVQEYLQGNDVPKHLIDITTHVSQFRPSTNINSIEKNLRLDLSKVYVFFSQGFVGLNSKKDSLGYQPYSRIPAQLGKSVSGFLRNNSNVIDHVIDHLSKILCLSEADIKLIIEHQILAGFIEKRGNTLINSQNFRNKRNKLQAS